MGILEFGIVFITLMIVFRGAIELPFLAKVKEWVINLDKN